jgi:hypothetical protein
MLERSIPLLQGTSRHRAELRAKFYYMGIKALLRMIFSVWIKTGLILLASCRTRS